MEDAKFGWVRENVGCEDAKFSWVKSGLTHSLWVFKGKRRLGGCQILVGEVWFDPIFVGLQGKASAWRMPNSRG